MSALQNRHTLTVVTLRKLEEVRAQAYDRSRDAQLANAKQIGATSKQAQALREQKAQELQAQEAVAQQRA